MAIVRKSQFAHNEKMTVENLDAIISSFMNGMPINTIIVKFHVGYSRVSRIIDWHLANSRTRPIQEVERRYWMSEQEMEVQQYKLEDLKGDELQIAIREL
jgi:hypothetical protein